MTNQRGLGFVTPLWESIVKMTWTLIRKCPDIFGLQENGSLSLDLKTAKTLLHICPDICAIGFLPF